MSSLQRLSFWPLSSKPNPHSLQCWQNQRHFPEFSGLGGRIFHNLGISYTFCLTLPSKVWVKAVWLGYSCCYLLQIESSSSYQYSWRCFYEDVEANTCSDLAAKSKKIARFEQFKRKFLDLLRTCHKNAVVRKTVEQSGNRLCLRSLKQKVLSTFNSRLIVTYSRVER